MTEVKICGIRDKQMGLAAIEAGADYVGFILSMPQTPRYLTVDIARGVIHEVRCQMPRLRQGYGGQADARCQFVGVFVDETKEFVERVAEECSLDVLQLHGQESPAYCEFFKEKKYRVWKSFRMKDEHALDQMQKYTDVVAAFHLDAYSSNRAGGGFGKIFDWDLAMRAKESGLPVVLSGGLDVGNVLGAIEKVGPDIVDVSSGVERIRGIKDKKMIIDFIGAVKNGS